MASACFCDPCTEENLSVSATKYCSDCEEQLCSACTESHTRFKAFKFHHLIELSTSDSNIQESAKKICNVHPDMLIDYYCTDHEVVCCRACIPKDHIKCGNVLLLEHASKHVKKSTLITDIMADIKHLVATLSDLHDNRESTIQSLVQTKSVITKQICEIKSRLLKQIDDVERGLHDKLSSLYRKHEIEITQQKEEISKVLDDIKANENEMDFMKNHGSNNQLFIALYHQASKMKNTEAKVRQIISNSPEIEITFDEKKDIKLEYLGTILESVRSCQVQYISKKFQQAQIMTQPTKHIAGFEMDAELPLKTGTKYDLVDACVTCDNKLLLTNYVISNPKLYVYRDCKDYETELTFTDSPFGVAVIPGTERGVVSLPDELSIQFINTKSMTKGDKVNVGFICYGITAGRDRIYVGGTNGTIKTLDINGKFLKSIKLAFGEVCFMSFDDRHFQLIVNCPKKLLCITLDGTLVYSKDVSGVAGVLCDRQGNVYYGDYFSSNIQRMSPDWKKCEEIMNKDNGIKLPYGMCLNNDFTKLFVINTKNTSVCVYNCK